MKDSGVTRPDGHVPQPLGLSLLRQVQRRTERPRTVGPGVVQGVAQRQAAGRLQSQQVVVRPERRRLALASTSVTPF